MAYNGHKNWNHWNVSLWIFNDLNWYDAARWAVTSAPNRDVAAVMLLGHLPSVTPDGAPLSFTSVRAALVGWGG